MNRRILLARLSNIRVLDHTWYAGVWVRIHSEIVINDQRMVDVAVIWKHVYRLSSLLRLWRVQRLVHFFAAHLAGGYLKDIWLFSPFLDGTKAELTAFFVAFDWHLPLGCLDTFLKLLNHVLDPGFSLSFGSFRIALLVIVFAWILALPRWELPQNHLFL